MRYRTAWIRNTIVFISRVKWRMLSKKAEIEWLTILHRRLVRTRMAAEGILVAELSPDQKRVFEELAWSHRQNPCGMDLHYAIRRSAGDTSDETMHHRLDPKQPLDVFELPSPEALIELFLNLASTVNRFNPLYIEDELPNHLPLVTVAMYRVVDGMPPAVIDAFLHRRFEALWRLVDDLEILFFENNPSVDSRRTSLRHAVRESEEFSFRETIRLFPMGTEDILALSYASDLLVETEGIARGHERHRLLDFFFKLHQTISGDDGTTIEEVCRAEPSSLLRDYAQVFFHNQDDPETIRAKTVSICRRLRDGVTLAEKIVVNATLLIGLRFPVSEIRTRLRSLLPSNREIPLDPTTGDTVNAVIGPLDTDGKSRSVIESIIDQTNVFQRELRAINNGDDNPLCEVTEGASRIGTLKERIALQRRLEDLLSVTERECFI